VLTFFRKIRKAFLDSGSTGKYLLYAVGEIALVVIGILIALQINNWNEWRKDRIKEKEVLNQIIETLEINEQILSGYIKAMDLSNQSNKIIIDAIDKDIDYSDTLDRHFLISFQQWTEGFVSHAGYERLKNIGMELIRSEPLRNEIVSLFENTYATMKERIEAWQIDPFIFKYMDENFIWLESGRASPKDFDSVMNDHYYYSILHRLVRTHQYMSRIQLDNYEETQRIVDLIKDELGETVKSQF
jgi:hypothetical protein